MSDFRNDFGFPGGCGADGLGADEPGIVTVIAPTQDTTAILPAGFPLTAATYTRRNGHLLVNAPDHPEVLVPRFFAGGGQTTLATRDGVRLSRHMVLVMSNLSARVEKALGCLTAHRGE